MIVVEDDVIKAYLDYDFQPLEDGIPNDQAVWVRVFHSDGSMETLVNLDNLEAARKERGIVLEDGPEEDDIEKYDPGQVRVPSGHGRESGRWVKDGVGTGSAQAVLTSTKSVPEQTSGEHLASLSQQKRSMGMAELEEIESHASVILEKASESRGPVQESLVRAVGDVAYFEGLSYAVKSRDSLVRKIKDLVVQTKKPTKQVAGEISDALRFTAIFDEGNYAEMVHLSINNIENQGHTLIKFKNYWGGKLDPTYQGLNTNFLSTNGQVFELQFHTKASFHVKEHLNHPLYEEERKIETPPARKEELKRQQIHNQMSVAVPHGALNLKRIPRTNP